MDQDQHQGSPLESGELCDDTADIPQQMMVDDAGPSSLAAGRRDEVLNFTAPCFPDCSFYHLVFLEQCKS